MRACLVTLVLLAAPVAGSQEEDSAAGAVVASRDLIASCIETSSGDEVGLAELEEACPGLEHAITQSGYVGFISENEIEQLTSHGLVDLQSIVERYRQPPAAAATDADIARLGPILDAIEEEQRVERPLTLFERFKRWMNGQMQRPSPEQETWLNRWLKDFDVPERITRTIVYASILVILLAALAVVVNELRAAGIFRRRGRRASVVPITGEGTFDLSRATLADLDRVPAAERPALLLRVLVNTLLNTGRLRTEKSLTHRELGSRAAFDAVDQRHAFNRVASLSERILYGSRQVSPEEIDAVLDEGRGLDRQLSTPRAKP
ncbi:DUF4129 domain-containing protein [Povalibacter sp.]|uniref:DUF4129 domain-containing protein n=1 Tax=Povalibacter sp. TaxID=1962978 RepID=UPI002F3F9EE6